jgi:alkanesulfonate monooxygenase SsuD/methylene tetrahydromethanopterin reductase-like flavin-dependent oxidoreductase (luciferase family)
MTTMEIGIGLPSTVPGTTGPQLTGWARQADASGFSSEGWILGGGAPDQFSSLAHRLDEAWADEGRDGRPMKKALAYFAPGLSGVARESPGVTV